MKYMYKYRSPLGFITIESDGEMLTGLYFGGEDISDGNDGQPILAQTVKWLDIYFSGKVPDFTPPISIKTTPFRKSVYDILLDIPYGQTVTYGEIAPRIAEQNGIKKMSAQAVGGAVGHNPIGIIIPCHRVIGTGGKLTGFAAGVEKKAALLNIEGVKFKL